MGLLFPSLFLNQFGVGLRFHHTSKALNEMRNMCGSQGETVGHRPLPYQQSPLTSSFRFYEVQSQAKGCVSRMLEDVVLFFFFPDCIQYFFEFVAVGFLGNIHKGSRICLRKHAITVGPGTWKPKGANHQGMIPPIPNDGGDYET